MGIKLKRLNEGTVALIAYQLQNQNFLISHNNYDGGNLLPRLKRAIKRSNITEPKNILRYADAYKIEDLEYEITQQELNKKIDSNLFDYTYVYYPMLNRIEVYSWDEHMTTIEEKVINKEIEIKEEVKVGDIILEAGDKISVLKNKE